MTIGTIFNVKDFYHVRVNGCGQAAIAEIDKQYPHKTKILKGFVINGQYIKADLTPSWNKTKRY